MRHYALLILYCLCWELVTPQVQGEEVLNNQDVVDLIKAGIAKELVIEKIKSCENSFDLTTKAMIQLKEQGVADDIIALMLQEQKSRRNKIRARLELEIQHLAADRPEVRNAAFLYISRLGEAAVGALQETLGHTRPEMRIAAAGALARLDHKESARLLRNLLGDAVPEVRLAAADSLGQLKDELAVDLAHKAVASDLKPLDGYVRLLGLFRDVKALGFLKLRLYEDSDPLTRSQCAWALGELGLAEAVQPLEDALLKDRAAIVRREAALSLGKIRAPASAGKLIKACMNDPEAREAILASLANFPAATSVPFLIFALNRHLNEAETRAALASLRKLTHQDFGANVARWNQWWEKNREAIEKEEGPSWRPEPEGGGENDKSEGEVSTWQPNKSVADEKIPPGQDNGISAEEDKQEEPPEADKDKNTIPEEKKEEGGEKENPVSGLPAVPPAAEMYHSAPPSDRMIDAYCDVVIPGMPALPRKPSADGACAAQRARRSGRFLLAEAGAMPSPSAPISLAAEDSPTPPSLHPYALTAETFEQELCCNDGRKALPPEQKLSEAASVVSESDGGKPNDGPEPRQSGRRRPFTADAYEQD